MIRVKILECVREDLEAIDDPVDLEAIKRYLRERRFLDEREKVKETYRVYTSVMEIGYEIAMFKDEDGAMILFRISKRLIGS